MFDHGQVRFWLQAEHLSPDASYRFVINDKEVSDSEVSSWVWGRGARLRGAWPWLCFGSRSLTLNTVCSSLSDLWKVDEVNE